MSEEAFTDIADAIYRLRVAFKRHHLEPPKALELSSHRDLDRLMAALPPDRVSFQPALHDKPVILCNIAGVEIVAPAEFRARKGGGYDVE